MSRKTQIKTQGRKSNAPARWCAGARSLPKGLTATSANATNRCAELLQALAQRGHADDDLLPLADFEKAVSAFSAEIAKRIPVQYHPDLHEAVESYCRRMMAAES